MRGKQITEHALPERLRCCGDRAARGETLNRHAFRVHGVRAAAPISKIAGVCHNS